MRVGDVYRIKRMLENGDTPKDVHKRFKNDYPEDEINKFIPTDAFEKETATEKATEKKALAEKKAVEKEAAGKKGVNKKDPLD